MEERSALPSPRRPAQGVSPARTSHGPLSGGRPPDLVPLDGCSVGGGVYPERAHRGCPTAAHAGDGTGNSNGEAKCSGQLSSPPGGSTPAGRPPEGGARSRG